MSATASPRMAAAGRRAHLLETAARVFVEGSYRGTTTAEIARAAGVSEPIIYRHFASKRDLYLATLEYVWEKARAGWVQTIADSSDACAAVEAIGKGQHSVRSAKLQLAELWVQALGEASEDPELRKHLRSHMREVHDFVSAVQSLLDRHVVAVLSKLVIEPVVRRLVLPDGARAYIPSESAGEVHLVDTDKNTVLKTVKLPKGCRPMCLKVSPDGRKVYVSTGRAGSIVVLDSSGLELLNTIKVGQRPWGIAISPDGKWLYSANGPSDDVSIVDLEGQKEVERIKAGQSPWGVVLVPKNDTAAKP